MEFILSCWWRKTMTTYIGRIYTCTCRYFLLIISNDNICLWWVYVCLWWGCVCVWWGCVCVLRVMRVCVWLGFVCVCVCDECVYLSWGCVCVCVMSVCVYLSWGCVGDKGDEGVCVCVMRVGVCVCATARRVTSNFCGQHSIKSLTQLTKMILQQYSKEAII